MECASLLGVLLTLATLTEAQSLCGGATSDLTIAHHARALALALAQAIASIEGRA